MRKDNVINYQFKILIAFAMIFVVAGHVGNSFFTLNGFFNYAYFHMPLFMFVSGYFFNSTISICREVIKQTKRLLLPFIGWNVFYGIIITYLRHSEFFKFEMGNDLSFYSLFVRSFIMGDAFILNVPSWFLFSLFLVKVIYICLRTLILFFNNKNHSENIIVLFLFFLGGRDLYW